MPTRDRVNQLLIDLVDAALDQPKPSPALKQAVNKYLSAIESELRPRGSQALEMLRLKMQAEGTVSNA